MNKIAKLGFTTAVSLVIANMVGTGVFTSLGFQLFDIKSPFAIICLWLVGGIIALCGALTYGEIGVALPRSGGEYNYLSKLYHPLIGFLSPLVLMESLNLISGSVVFCQKVYLKLSKWLQISELQVGEEILSEMNFLASSLSSKVRPRLCNLLVTPFIKISIIEKISQKP